MSARIRGQEITIRVAVDGQVQPGSMFKVQNFTATPRTDLVEEDYLGELESDLDIQHHGFDLAWACHEQDAVAIDLLSNIVAREQNAERHPDITVTVFRRYRNGTQNRAEVYHDCFVKVAENGFGGRKEYVGLSFEAKAKKRSVVTI